MNADAFHGGYYLEYFIAVDEIVQLWNPFFFFNLTHLAVFSSSFYSNIFQKDITKWTKLNDNFFCFSSDILFQFEMIPFK